MADSIKADFPNDLASAEAALNQVAESLHLFLQVVDGDVSLGRRHVEGSELIAEVGPSAADVPPTSCAGTTDLLLALQEQYEAAEKAASTLLPEIEVARGVTPFHFEAPSLSGRSDSTTATGALLKLADYVLLILTSAKMHHDWSGLDAEETARAFRGQLPSQDIRRCQQAIHLELVQTAQARQRTKQRTKEKNIKSPRRMNDDARECVRRFKNQQRTGGTVNMKRVVTEYVAENPGKKFDAIYRILTDNPDHW